VFGSDFRQRLVAIPYRRFLDVWTSEDGTDKLLRIATRRWGKFQKGADLSLPNTLSGLQYESEGIKAQILNSAWFWIWIDSNIRANKPTQIFGAQRVLNIMHLNNTPIFVKIILILSQCLAFSRDRTRHETIFCCMYSVLVLVDGQ
jgi:hypothetical protein